MRRIFQFILISSLFLLGIFIYHSIAFSDKNLHLIFCNVGQGDGIFVRTPSGADIVIDGGPESGKMVGCLSRHMPIWDRTIEAVFLTHPDADHLNGLIPIIQTYSVKYFGTSKVPKESIGFAELMKSLRSKKVKVNYVFDGDEIRSKDGFDIKTFWPTEEFVNGIAQRDDNYYSLIQKISYGKFHALLDGDSPYQVLDPVMNSIDSLDIFKPAHHGSKTGTHEFTFRHLVPRLAILSFGLNNRYHHPSPEVLSLLTKYNIPYKNTLKGDVEIVSDGKSWWVK